MTEQTPGSEIEVETQVSTTDGHKVGERRGSFRASGSGDTSGFGGLVRSVVVPGATSRPFGGYFDELADTLLAALEQRGVPAQAIEFFNVQHGQLTAVVSRQHLLGVAQALRDEASLRFEAAMSVNGVHWPEDHGRELHAEYQLISYTHNRRLSLKVTCPDADSHIPSLVSVWPGLDWHERETYDFFGIIFDGHPALTRIAMPDDWVGHPQRKDYPLGGINVEFKGVSVPAPSLRRKYS